jgi:hypothetical protein
LLQVKEFVGLARGGAYMYGREVSRQQRSQWRVTFRELAVKAQSALHAEDTQPGEQAVELLVGLAVDSHRYDFFHSGDPMEAARFVVSDAVSALWQTVLAQHGLPEFARRAAPQLISWESRSGWTHGYGKVAEREVSLASVLEEMLTTPAQWTEFGGAYLAALDAIAPLPGPRLTRERAYELRDRTDQLAGWHYLLIERLSEADADRLVANPALGGPELTFLRAQLTDRRGDRVAARKLIEECVAELPGHLTYIQYALDIGAEVPPFSRERLEQQRGAWPRQSEEAEWMSGLCQRVSAMNAGC